MKLKTKTPSKYIFCSSQGRVRNNNKAEQVNKNSVMNIQTVKAECSESSPNGANSKAKGIGKGKIVSGIQAEP